MQISAEDSSFGQNASEERLALIEELAVLKTLVKGILKTAYANMLDTNAASLSIHEVGMSQNIPNEILSLELAHLLNEMTRLNRALNPSSSLSTEDTPPTAPATLENLVAKLNPDLPIERMDIRPPKTAAKFSWPIRGDIYSTPGSALREGGAKWPGVLIKADSDTEVRSIAAGKVVYAGEMKNLGLLIMIDHEDGHLSLYGRNSKILVSQNERIEKHQTISSIANLSDDTDNGLYFEIRRDGKPVDPRLLCAETSKSR